MPKASSATTGPALRRNQACKQCRKRKLKCDANKPHCGTCVKQWTAQVAVPPPVGFSHPTEPMCQYDHMDGLVLTPENVENPVERIKLLESQIADLQVKLSAAQHEQEVQNPFASTSHQHSRNDSSTSTSMTASSNSNHHPHQHRLSHSSTAPSSSGLSSPPKHMPSNIHLHPFKGSPDSDFTPTANQQHHHIPARPNSGLSSAPSPPNSSSGLTGSPSGGSRQIGEIGFLHSGAHLGADNYSLTNMSSSNGGSHRKIAGNVNMDVDSELLQNGQYNPFGQSGNNSPYVTPFDLIVSGWNPDLPEPRLLNHLVTLYFTRDTCASRILHRPTFHLAMTLPPTHPDFPHPALLHAICASASRWTLASRDVKNGSRDKFAEFHAAKTRHYIDQTIATGQNIFSVLLACIVLSWWFYSEGRWVEIWSHAGFLIRVSIPLGLNFPGTHPSTSAASPYLAPPRNPTDLEQRRRAWWMCVAFDRIVSVGGWPHAIDERDVGTEFPLRRIDFEQENPVPSNPQDLATENFLIRHSPQYTDPFILFIKACMLWGKVTDYNCRMVNLRAPRSPVPLSSSSTTHSQQPSAASYRPDPRMAAGFRGLDRLVAVEFLANLPAGMKSCLGVQQGHGNMKMGQAGDIDGTALDTDLYMVHIIPHAATITLHNPYINFADPQDTSSSRCMEAARAILNAYYLITSTSFDIKRLHPFVTICWYLAAVVLVQLCKRAIEIGDRAGESAIWGEINLMRLAMLDFGSVSPIGVRQEKLLQGLMVDILRLTSQAQPLNVGVPLYPFSKTSLYDPTFQPTISEVIESAAGSGSGGIGGGGGGKRTHIPSHAAPLPIPSSYEDDDRDHSGSGIVGNALGIGGIAAAFGLGFGGPSMLSSQGIWHPLDDITGAGGSGTNGVHHMGSGPGAAPGGAGMEIFDQLGLS